MLLPSLCKDEEEDGTFTNIKMEVVKEGPIFQRNAPFLSVRCSNVMAVVAPEVVIRTRGEYEFVNV